MPSPALDKLDAAGEDEIIARIERGMTQREIATEFGISNEVLVRWLHRDPNRSARAKVAMAESAEAWLDRGFQALHDAPPDASEIQRARAIEQHCARRAEIRNPQYRDKQDHTHAGPNGGPIEHQQRVLVEFVKPVDNAEIVK